MPRVPTYESRVNRQSAQIPQVQGTSQPPPDVYGEQNFKTNAYILKQIENIGDALSQHAYRMAEQENRKNFIVNDSEFRDGVQNILLNNEVDENDRPVGLLNRKLSQTKDAVIEFDDKFKSLSDDYLKRVAPSERNSMLQSIKSNYLAAREAVLRHEAREMNSDYEITLKNNIDKSIAVASIIGEPDELREVIIAETANHAKSISYIRPNKSDIENSKVNIAGEMVKSSVSSMLDVDYKKAAEILEKNKDLIAPSVYSNLSGTIQGKAQDAINQGVWNSVKGFKLSDGMSDTAKMEAAIKSMNVPANQQEKVWDYVRSAATVQDGQYKKQREANDREFTNEVIQAHSQGIDFESAKRIAGKYAYDSTDLADKHKEIEDLYSGSRTNFDVWINKQPEETQAAWDYAKNILKTKFDNKEKQVAGFDGKVNLYQAAVAELKIQALNKSPEAIRKLANDKIKDVVVTPRDWWIDEKSPEIIKDVSTRQVISNAISELEKLYGEDTVSQAREYLIRNKQPDTPKNIATLINKRSVK